MDFLDKVVIGGDTIFTLIVGAVVLVILWKLFHRPRGGGKK